MGCGVNFLTIFGRFEALNALKIARIDGKCGVRAGFFFIHETGGGAAVFFFSAANNMRGAGITGADGRCLRNYKSTLWGLTYIDSLIDHKYIRLYLFIMCTWL